MTKLNYTNTKKVSVFNSLAWTLLESVGVFGISLASLPIFAHYLSPKELGLSAMALGIVQLLTIFVESCLPVGLIQRSEVSLKFYSSANSGCTLLGLFFMLCCFIFAKPFSDMIGQHEMGDVLMFMSISMPFAGVSAALTAWQRRNMDFKPLAMRTIAGRIIGGLVGIAMAVFGFGIWSVVVQQVFMAASAAACLWWFAKERPGWKLHLNEFIYLARFGSYTMLNMLLNLSVQRIFILVVGIFSGPDVSGYFSLAFRSVDVLRDVFANAVGQLALPIYARVKSDMNQLRSLYIKSVDLTSFLMFPLFVGLAACSHEVVALVFGEKWQVAAPLIRLFSFLTIIHFSRMFVLPYLNAIGKPAGALINASVQLLVIAASVWWLKAGAWYLAAFIWAIRLLPSTILDFVVLNVAGKVSYHEQYAKPALNLIGSVLMFVSLYAVSQFTSLSVFTLLITKISLGAVIYILYSLAFRRDNLLLLRDAVVEKIKHKFST